MTNALLLDDVRRSFGPVEILRGVTLDIRQGERHAVIGPNGAGKSTLFNVISGRLAPTSGTIALFDRPIGGLQPQIIARAGLARSFQITSIFATLTVFENIRTAVLWQHGKGYSLFRRTRHMRDVTERTDQIIEEIGLAAVRDTAAGQLSYAEQRALEIGLIVACDARVLLLDEPTAGMNHAEIDRVVELLRAISAGRTLVIVEHDMSVVFRLADRISVLVHGEVIATGAPQDIRSNRKVQEAYLGEVVD